MKTSSTRYHVTCVADPRFGGRTFRYLTRPVMRRLVRKLRERGTPVSVVPVRCDPPAGYWGVARWVKDLLGVDL